MVFEKVFDNDYFVELVDSFLEVFDEYDCNMPIIKKFENFLYEEDVIDSIGSLYLNIKEQDYFKEKLESLVESKIKETFSSFVEKYGYDIVKKVFEKISLEK